MGDTAATVGGCLAVAVAVGVAAAAVALHHKKRILATVQRSCAQDYGHQFWHQATTTNSCNRKHCQLLSNALLPPAATTTTTNVPHESWPKAQTGEGTNVKAFLWAGS